MSGQSPAQPLINLRDKLSSMARRFSGQTGNRPPARPDPVDDSWHRDMVERANQSFRDAAARDAAAKAAAKRTPSRTPTRSSASAQSRIRKRSTRRP